jgi:hypothetical protein
MRFCFGPDKRNRTSGSGVNANLLHATTLKAITSQRWRKRRRYPEGGICVSTVSIVCGGIRLDWRIGRTKAVLKRLTILASFCQKLGFVYF